MKNLRYFFQYMKDKKVSIFKKMLIIGSLLYFVLPTDIVPDFIFALGWLDDAAVAAFIWNAVRTELQNYIAKQRIIDSKILSFEDKKRDKQS